MLYACRNYNPRRVGYVVRKYHSRKSLLKITVFGLVLLLSTSTLTLHTKVSASTTEQEVRATDQGVRFDSNLELQDEKIRYLIESPVFSEFDAWGKQYLEGNFGGGSEQLKRGENLAAKRRELFKELIRLSPKAALERAISAETYKRLPASISENLERRVSDYGDLLVYVVDEVDHSTGKMTGSRTEREVVIGDSKYTAFVYGRREAMTTKLDIPLQGIVLDGMIAVDENVVRKLEPTEYESRGVDLSKLGEYGIPAEVGGKVVHFSNQSELENFVREQIEWEAKIGPARPKERLAPEELASPWTEGPKTVLLIRVDFPDRPGEPLDANNQPLTTVRAQNLFVNEVNPFYVNSSYNKTSLQVAVTSVVRLPQPLAFYEQDNNYAIMEMDARNAAREAGFETNNYNLDIFAFSYSQNFNWAGLGSLGGKGTWLNGYFDLRVTAHELGHNYGLHHANLWRTTDGTVIGQGNDIEYGDSYDMMGFGDGSQFHFNTRYKRTLDWLIDANVQTVTTDGVYRIFAQDVSTSAGIRALKIKKDGVKHYWIEFRQLFTGNPNVQNGATIRWEYPSGSLRRTQLLDMTPTTSGNTFDAPLLIGQSFNDNENRIRLTVLGKGNTAPESLDVRVELNVGCSFSLGQTTQSFSAIGGEGIITVNTQSGCRPQAISNDSWLYAETTDMGAARYIVAANYSSQPRVGTITVANQTFNVQQGAATTACVASPSGQVAWWRGEGNALDQTEVNNGTLINNMTFGGGRVGGGFLGNYTNNAGIVEVPDSSSLALNRSMTFEGWLKVDSYGGTIIERRTTDFPSILSYEVWILSSGELFFTVWSNSNQGTGIISPNPLPLGEFVHFAASLDDVTGQIKMYINGSLVRQHTITQRPNIISGAKINVGNVNGITDELSVYNRALSASDIQAVYNAGTATTGAAGKCLSTDPTFATVQFSTSNFTSSEGTGIAVITVTRVGNTSGAATVDYATTNGTATDTSDYTASLGTLRFAAGESSKTFTIFITNDAFVEDAETVDLTLSNPMGASLATPHTAILTINSEDTTPPMPTANPVDDSQFFVRQHYRDFLNRDPDTAGLQFWTNEITSCGSNVQCREAKRDNVSAAFFLSIEFQETGYFAYRAYKTAYSDATSPGVSGTVPVIRLREFLTDSQRMGQGVQVGIGNWQQQLEDNKNAYALEFVQRQRFLTAHPSAMTADAFVMRLDQNAGGVLSADEKAQLVSMLGSTPSDAAKRAQVVRAVAEDADLRRAELNRAFVLMQYYGYLRRNPDDPQDTNFAGWKSWLDKLNQFNGNFVNAEMVKAFISSIEYRQRFGQ